MHSFEPMVFGLIGAGLQIAQTVKGAVDAGKAAKGAKDEGGAAAEAGGAKKAGGEAKAKPEENPVDRFLGLLNNPNVRSLADVKKVRDDVLGKLEAKGVKGDKLDRAKKKLNLAVLQKLGLAPNGTKGDAEIPLTAKNKRILDFLGMKPDEVKGAAPAAQPPAHAPPNKAPAIAAPGGKPG